MKKYNAPFPSDTLLDQYARGGLHRDLLRRMSKGKKEAEETLAILDDIDRPVRFHAREQVHQRFRVWVWPADVHRHELSEAYYQHNFERAYLVRGNYEPGHGDPEITMEQFIAAHLKTRAPGMGMFDHLLSMSQHAVRGLMRVRKEHPDDLKAQRQEWMTMNRDPLDYDNLVHALNPAQILPFDNWDDLDVGYVADPVDYDPSPEEQVERLLDAERLPLWLATLDDEDREMVLMDAEEVPLEDIVEKLGLDIHPTTARRRIDRLIEGAVEFFGGNDPPDDG